MRPWRMCVQAVVVGALIGASAGTTLAARISPASAPTPASAPARVITDIAGWQHPVKAVFEKHGLSLMQVTLDGAHATFRVAFPFDPQTPPNAAAMAALYDDVLQANGWHGYTLESLQDGLAIDVGWNPRTRTLAPALRRL